MAKPLFLLLILFQILLLIANATNTPGPMPAPSPIPTPILLPPPAPSQRQSPQPTYHQLNNIVDALIGSGDFNSWANILSLSDPLFFPLSATLFIPNDAALPPPTTLTTPYDPYIFPYHIVPQRLAFSDLLLFKPFSRLPTFLPFKSILITNNSNSNFTLDGILLSEPDLYVSSSVAIHGIDSLFNYTVYGDNGFEVVAPPPPALPPPMPGMFVPAGDVVFPLRGSDGSCMCTEVWVVFILEIFWFLKLVKIQRSSLGC